METGTTPIYYLIIFIFTKSIAKIIVLKIVHLTVSHTLLSSFWYMREMFCSSKCIVVGGEGVLARFWITYKPRNEQKTVPTLCFGIQMGKKFNLKNKAVGGSQRLIGCMWCSGKPMANERRPFSFILEEAWVRPRMKTEPGVPTKSGSTTFHHYDVH